MNEIHEFTGQAVFLTFLHSPDVKRRPMRMTMSKYLADGAAALPGARKMRETTRACCIIF
jgi:hypothetical protein